VTAVSIVTLLVLRLAIHRNVSLAILSGTFL